MLEEKRYSINQLAGKIKVHPATVWRWVMRGVKQTKLDAINIGGRRFVTESAWNKFMQVLNSDSKPMRTESFKSRQKQAVGFLESEGF